MSFWKSLERNVFRPIGRGAKTVAPIAGGIVGTALGGPLGGALGSSLGGALKRGKFDLKNALMDGGSSLLFNGIASKLGGIPGLGGGAKGGVPDLAPMKNMVGMTAGNGLSAGISGAAPLAAGGIADAAKSAVAEGGKKWLTGKNIAAVGDAAIGGMQAYNGAQQNKLQQQQYEDFKRREEEDREREQAMDPMRSQLLQQIMMRLQGNTMPQVR